MNELEIAIKRARNCITKLEHLRDSSKNGDIIHVVNGRLGWFRSLVSLTEDYNGKFYSRSLDLVYDLTYLKRRTEDLERYLEKLAKEL